jgi:hypothetical protein
MSKPVFIKASGVPIEYHVTNLGYVTHIRFSMGCEDIPDVNKLYIVRKVILADDMLTDLRSLRKNKRKLYAYLKSLIYPHESYS